MQFTGGLHNKKWSLLKNFRINVEKAAVTTATLPEGENEYIECWDNNLNNTEVFEDIVPVSPGINSVTRLADAGDASIAGPIVNDRKVVGTGALASRATNCQQPGCSSLEITTREADWTLVDLTIYAAKPVSVAFDNLSWEIDRAALRLYGVSHGSFTTGLHFVDVGGAHFLISGITEHGPGIRWATNSTPITARKVDGGWKMDPFWVTHVDSAGEAWTVNIPATEWD